MKASESKEPPIVSLLRADLENITNFIAAEAIKLARSNEGRVDVGSANFQALRTSMLDADPKKNEGRATLSLKGTEQGIEEKIAKEIAKGADPKAFEAFRAEMAAHRANLETKLSTHEGVVDLIADKLKKDALNKSVVLMREGSTTELITFQEKKDIVDNLRQNTEKLSPTTVHMMLSSPAYETFVQQEYKKSVDRNFSAEGSTPKDGRAATYDSQKFKRNSREFDQEVSANIASAAIEGLSMKSKLSAHEKDMLLKDSKKLSQSASKGIKARLYTALKRVTPQFKTEGNYHAMKEIRDVAKASASKAEIFVNKMMAGFKKLQSKAVASTEAHAGGQNQTKAKDHTRR